MAEAVYSRSQPYWHWGGCGGREEGNQKDPPTSFSPVTSTNAGISP